MCLLSYIPAGVIPNYEHLHNGADDNRDGHGWAIACTEHHRIHVGKSLDPDVAIFDFSEQRAKCSAGHALFHSRWSTGGVLTEYNVHPFYLRGDKQTVMAHNGILFTPPKNERRSDTRVWAEDVVPQLYSRLDRAGVQTAIHNRLGASNKVLFLTINPRYQANAYLFGEQHGTWVDGVWHSNNGWMEPVKYEFKGGGYDCRTCGAKYSCHYGVCMECDTCNWCQKEVSFCTCWSGGKAKEIRESLRSVEAKKAVTTASTLAIESGKKVST